ncbi:E3 ubiquitin-protein ligase RING1-like [Diospyros lotus]|uniref:E3 ubiquitin-protein ligase RING1-like n=1 Tax=Diospyros lotus TaxID=55363 RepID=UPI00224D0563|nr:E3 ubiquitin-protein ligase RING1-like [Diospyros lotus]
MSAPGNSSSGCGGEGCAAAPQPQRYFCHQCHGTVSITPTPTSKLICPNCSGGFLEEWVDDDQPPFPNPYPSPSRNPNSGAGLATSGNSDGAAGGAPPNRSPPPTLRPSSEEFNPFAFLQNYINTLKAGGANIQLVIENNSSDPGSGGQAREENLD